jgi:hypothetical protein
MNVVLWGVIANGEHPILFARMLLYVDEDGNTSVAAGVEAAIVFKFVTHNIH